MYWLKACPRCNGDFHEESDTYGAYVSCVQCGYVLRDDEERALRASGALERVAVVRVERAA